MKLSDALLMEAINTWEREERQTDRDRGRERAGGQPPDMYKAFKNNFFIVLKSFVKFTAKHQCQSLFFNEVASQRLCTGPLPWILGRSALRNKFFTQHSRATASGEIFARNGFKFKQLILSRKVKRLYNQFFYWG